MDTKTLGIIGGVALVIALLSPLVLGSAKKVEIHYNHAENLFENRKFEEAIKIYEKAIKASNRIGARPKFIDNDFTGLANYKIALCYEKLGEISDFNRRKYYPIALNHIRQSISKTDEIRHKSNLTFLWAEILFKNKMPLEADEKYSHFIRLYPKSSLVEEALYKIGIINSNPRNYEEAHAAFNRLIDEFPTTNYRTDIEHRLSNLLVENNKTQNVNVDRDENAENKQLTDETLYQTAVELKKQDKAFDAFLVLKTITDNPNSQYLSKAYELIADIYTDVSNYPEARRYYQLAIDRTNNPTYKQLLDNKSKETYFVPEDMDETVGPKTNNSDLFRKATSLRFNGKFLEAATLFKRLAISDLLSDDKVYALYWCGYCYYMAGGNNKEYYKESIEYFNILISEYAYPMYIERMDLISSYLHLVKAYSYIADGTDDSNDIYSIIINLIDTADKRFRVSAYSDNLEMLNEMQEIKRRIVGKSNNISDQNGLKPEPTREDIFVEEGRIHYNNDELEEAVSFAKRALETKPGLEIAELLLSDIKDRYYVRGSSFIDKNMLDIGINELNKCLELDRNDKRIHAKIGFAYIHMGEYEKSIKPLMNAIEIDNRYKKAYFNLAIAYYGLDSFEYALHYVNMALEIDATYESAIQLRDAITE